jgi:hypothetical protein
MKESNLKHVLNQMIEFIKISDNWNANPVSPEVNIKMIGNNLVMQFFLNHRVFANFTEGDKAKITFENCSAYSLNTCNDEGYYYGQYRITPNELPWGEFYEIKSGLNRNFPEPVSVINNNSNTNRHFIFFFKDETFECLADDYKIEFENVEGK